MRQSFLVLLAATMFLALSGFECASTQETTARVALQRKDYKAAEAALKKELELHPQNTGAWKLLGDVYYEQARYAEMDNAYRQAEGATQPLKDDDRKDIAGKRYNAWRESYNLALSFYNKGVTQNSDALYQRALGQIDTAAIIRPDYAENLYVRASLLGALKQDAQVRQTYLDYVKAIGQDMEQGTKLGLSLGMTPQQVAAKLGQPTNQKIDTLGGFTYYDPQKLYIYYDVPTAGAAAGVSGWKFFPTAVPEFIAQTPWPIHIAPYQFLGVEAFRAGESDKARYNDALNYLKMAAMLDPGNQDIQQLISETYVNSGRIAEARAALEAQIRQNPSDPSLYITYGNLLFQAKDYNGAAQNFQKVVDLNLDKTNPNLAIALFNLAAVYKNRGAELQDSIRSAIGPTASPTPAQIEIFRKPLRQAAKYFEQLKTNGRDKDFTLLAELGNVYDVLGEKEKVKQMLNEIVALKNVAGNQTNASYWSALSRFYAIMGDVKNAEDADRKATELSK